MQFIFFHLKEKITKLCILAIYKRAYYQVIDITWRKFKIETDTKTKRKIIYNNFFLKLTINISLNMFVDIMYS